MGGHAERVTCRKGGCLKEEEKEPHLGKGEGTEDKDILADVL